jgi:hypothetical protein
MGFSLVSGSAAKSSVATILKNRDSILKLPDGAY